MGAEAEPDKRRHRGGLATEDRVCWLIRNLPLEIPLHGKTNSMHLLC